MIIKLILNRETYHTKDQLSDSVDETGKTRSSTCGGYNAFCKVYPDFKAWLLANPPGKTINQAQEVFYLRFLQETQGKKALEVEIQPIQVEKLGAILLTKAEIKFQAIALLAQKELRTAEEEQKLLNLKEAIVCLSKYKQHCCAYISCTGKVTHETLFGVLRHLPEDVKEYVMTPEGKIVGCVPVHAHEHIYVLVPAVEDAAPPLKLGFDGKNFIAVYTANLPKLPDSTMKLLQLPAVGGTQ